jgi:hypothetical protein
MDERTRTERPEMMSVQKSGPPTMSHCLELEGCGKARLPLCIPLVGRQRLLAQYSK